MKSALLYITLASAICLTNATLQSCIDNKPAAVAIDTLTAGTPRKGVIWDKKRIIDLPLSLEENNMRGKVRTVTYTRYLPKEKNGETEWVRDVYGSNIYNEWGYLVEQTEYYADGKPKRKCIYTYNANNKPAIWHFKFFDRNDEYKTTFHYDDNGNNAEQVVTNSDSLRSERIIHRYDNRDNEIEEITLDDNGMMKRATISRYDKIGNQVMHVNISAGGDTTFQLTAKYDSNGYKIAGAIYMGGKLITKWKQKNDDNGKAMEKTEYSNNGMLTRKILYKYDSLGNITEIMNYDKDANLDNSAINERYQFKYDSHGNITEETKLYIQKGIPRPQCYTSYTYSYY